SCGWGCRRDLPVVATEVSRSAAFTFCFRFFFLDFVVVAFRMATLEVMFGRASVSGKLLSGFRPVAAGAVLGTDVFLRFRFCRRLLRGPSRRCFFRGPKMHRSRCLCRSMSNTGTGQPG